MIISIKSSTSGSSRGLTHYLAHSKLDQEKEGAGSREFFNETDESLDVKTANQHLSRSGQKPGSEELLHIIIAPSLEETESVGSDQPEQKEALKAITRETVAELEKQVKARQLKWVAVVHFNTAHPHVHLALQKEFINETGLTENLRITRQMLHFNERGENGVKSLRKGSLIIAAENKIQELSYTRQLEPEKVITFSPGKNQDKSEVLNEITESLILESTTNLGSLSERRILAAEMMAAEEVEQRTMNLENLIEHGSRKRFKIKDEQTGRTEHISLFDIERKIETVSRQKAWAVYPKNPEKREAAMVSFNDTEREKYSRSITQLETIRRHVLGFENRHLNEAQEKHIKFHNQKLLIEKKYTGLNAPLPLPLFTSEEIQSLQTQALSEQNIEKILLLENIRHDNAREFKTPSRRDQDVQQLLAAKIVATLKLQAAEKRLDDFPKIKMNMKVKIGKSIWSHQSLAQAQFESDSNQQIWSKILPDLSRRIFRSQLTEKEKLEPDYSALRTQISEALENKEKKQVQEVNKRKDFLSTLDQIFQADTNSNKTRLLPAFSSSELGVVEDLALETGQESLYEQSLEYQESWLVEKIIDRVGQTSSGIDKISDSFGESKNHLMTAEKTVGNYLNGRAAARLELAETKAALAEENLLRYKQDKFFIKHAIIDSKTGLERRVSLSEVEPKKHYYLLDAMIARLLESKDQKQIREFVQSAAVGKEKELESNLQNASNSLERLKNQQNAIQEKYKIAQETTPIFTPKEIAALETRKHQTNNKRLVMEIENMIAESEENNQVERLQSLLEKTVEKLQVIEPILSNEQDSLTQQHNNLTKEQQILTLQPDFSYTTPAEKKNTAFVNSHDPATHQLPVKIKQPNR